MKLNTIAIDGYRQLRDLRLNEISPTLNVIYGERGSGKTRVADFVKSVLFGATTERSFHNGHDAPELAHGHIEATHGGGRYQLSRTAAQQSLQCVPVAGAIGTDLNHRLESLTGGLDAATYDAVFDVSFAHSHVDEKSFAAFLHHGLGVPIGIGATENQPANASGNESANRLREELAATSANLLSLQHSLSKCNDDLARIDTTHSGRILHIQTELSRIALAISAAASGGVNTAAIDVEIRELQLRISTAQSTVVQKPAATTDMLSGLYTQLDEVDVQLRRWVSVQNDVQQQRIRLKDEMLLWNKMTLDSESHPYHKAREILMGLEHRVDNAQAQTVQWLDTHGPIDSQQAATFVDEVCNGMRDDLYQLCSELSQQYKHIRHKSAATELKQLRRCYEEMEENTQRLASRRDAVVGEIRKLDPAGAEVIGRAETDFCKCAHHEGFLRARQRFAGELQPLSLAHETYVPDLSTELDRLATLETQRAEVLSRSAASAAELSRLHASEQQLSNELTMLRDSSDTLTLQAQKRTLETEIQLNTDRIKAIKSALDRLPTASPLAPDPLLVSAARLLDRMSGGDLVSVWLDVAHTPGTNGYHAQASVTGGQSVEGVDLQARDRYGKVFNSAGLSPALRDLTRLSLVLAAKQQLANRGVEAPLVIDELFGAMESARASAVLEVVSEFSTRGQHQVILLTQHRFLIDRLPGAKLFDIESRTSLNSYSSVAPIASVTPTRPLERPAVSFPVVSPNLNTSARDWPTVHSVQPTDQTIESFPRRYASPSVTSIGADQIGDRLEQAVSFEEHSRLAEVPIFDALQLRTLEDAGILTVGDFLAFPLSSIPRQWIEIGLSEVAIENLQAEVWLLTCVPALRPSDAHVLVACGITEPEQLETSDAQVLFERIDRYVSAHENGTDVVDKITRGRISDWHRGLSRTRDRWQRRSSRAGNVGRDGNRNRDGNRSRNGHARGDQTTQQPAMSGGPSLRTSLTSDYATGSNGDSYQRQPSTRDARDRGPRIRKFSPNATRQQREAVDQSRVDRDGSRSADRPVVRNPRSTVARPDFPDSNGELERQSDYRRYDDRNPRGESAREQPRDTTLRGREMRSERQEIRSPRFQGPTADRARMSVPALAPQASRESDVKPTATRQSPQSSKTKYKFYLDLNDHIEAAPSIGPKTAERFEKIGVKTIDDFLKQTADSMAMKLNYKRITDTVIRNWQNQARLVCRIPNLRGHDAQILVACDMLDPEEIAEMHPQTLFQSVGPFSETKEGQKIIRSGKKPDLAEITDWIAWAQKTRSIQAA